MAGFQPVRLQQHQIIKPSVLKIQDGLPGFLWPQIYNEAHWGVHPGEIVGREVEESILHKEHMLAMLTSTLLKSAMPVTYDGNDAAIYPHNGVSNVWATVIPAISPSIRPTLSPTATSKV